VSRKQTDAALVQAILFMAVVSFFLGKAALNGEQEQEQRQKAA
jgi:hypothetical protein